MRKSKIIWGLAFILVFVFISQIVVSNAIGSRGATLAGYEEKIKTLAAENALLRDRILEKTSLVRIASSSAELGLASPEKIIYLGDELDVASQPRNDAN